jgi:hypothetical protein
MLVFLSFFSCHPGEGRGLIIDTVKLGPALRRDDIG